MVEKQHGGKREGAGRKPKGDETTDKQIWVRVSNDQKNALIMEQMAMGYKTLSDFIKYKIFKD